MNILSISGGGCRGIIPLYILRELERKYKKPIAEMFNYFSGSSIGSVIIMGLLITEDGKNPKYTCEKLYEIIGDMCKKIFSNTYYHRIKTVYGLFGPKYPIDIFEKILEEVLGDKKIKDLLKPVCFPSFDGTHHKAIYITKEKHGELLLKEIVRAVTAAPTYFEPKKIEIDGHKIECCEKEDNIGRIRLLYDSGIVVNNPCLIANLYATHEMTIVNKNEIYELCLGTGEGSLTTPSNYGLWGWFSSIIGHIYTGFNNNELEGLYLALGEDHILNVEVKIENKYDVLDNPSDEYMNYYVDKISEWLIKNDEKIYKFMDKVIENNKKLDKDNINI